MIRFTGGTDLQQETALQDVIDKLYDKPSMKSVVARDKTCFHETYEYASLKTPSFSSQDKAKARKDEKAPANRYFVTHRTDAIGCLTMDDQVTIEDSEHYARKRALDLARELKKLQYCHLDLGEDTFFKRGSEERKVYTFQPLQPLSKSQRTRIRRKKLQAVKEHERI